MAEIRCPNCGKDNPTSLTFCQYCQALLNPETTMHIGDKPTKKNTGELEPVLPDWLKDVRQQARDLAEKDAAQAATLPKIQKEEPPDLLAGLASQSTSADEEDIPDWLASLTPKQSQKPAAPASPAKPDSDFFAQFDKPSAVPQDKPEPPQPVSESETPAPAQDSPERDELSEWFSKASAEPVEPFSLESGTQEDLGWDLKGSPSFLPRQETAPESQNEEDLSWLRNLEAESKRTGELSGPKQDDEWIFGEPAQTGSSNQDDLSWLDNLGSLPASEQPQQEPSEPGGDLGWLNAFGESTQASQPASTPPAPQDDLSWLKDLGSIPAAEEPGWQASQPEEDFSWLEELGKTSEPAQPLDFEQTQPASGEDLSWLRDLQGRPGALPAGPEDSSSELGRSEAPAELPHVSPFTPRRTAPLGDAVQPEIPDWLKSATEEPSLPMGPQALDRMREDRKTPSVSDDFTKALFGVAMASRDEQPAPSRPEAPSAEPGAPASEPAPLFAQDVNSLFSEGLPDWLSSSQPEASQPEEEIGIHAEGGEALSPADLPSWVQAMRPVEAVISESVPDTAVQPAEREGPLAGLRGVIPAAVLGSLRRPRPVPLTLQVTEDQQASAAILEQILSRETTPRPLVAAPVLTSQRTLRWVISGLVFFVLAAVLFSGTQIMPVSPILPAAAGNVTNVVMNIADNAPVLVIVDYEPALTGEMEATSGPVLDQLVQLHRPYLSFVSTSPSGNALVERLLRNTKINQPDGAGYVADQNYSNLGYLSGGESGVLAFLQSPQTTIPASRVLESSEYAAIFLLTDHAESARTWIEQLSTMKQANPVLASQPLIAISSAQTGPMLQPYMNSGQITGMVSGLPIAARYELLNNNRPGTARAYWDAFGVGMMMAVFLIVLGSLWSLYTGIRPPRAQAAEE